MRKLALILVAGALAWGIFAALHRHATKRAAENHHLPLAPQLMLTDLSGKTFDTAALKGQIIVVNFWAAWCTPCTEEIPRFVSLQRKYRNQGLQIIGISIDDADSELRDFYKRHEMNYPVIAGTQKIAQAYGGILGLPTTLIFGRDGRMQKKLVGATDFTELEQQVAGLLAQPNI